MPNHLSWFTLFLAALVLLALAACVVSGRIAKLARGTTAVTIAVLRLTILALFAALAWLAFYGADETKQAHEAGKRRIAILQDASTSMSFLTPNGRPRSELANQVTTLVEEGVREANSEWEVVPFRFAANMVPAADAGALVQDGTGLVRALSQALERDRFDALLVVSDGASTDGPPPPYLLDWAGNRGTSLAAICAAPSQAATTDLAVAEAQATRINPGLVSAQLDLTHGKGTPVVAVLEVDGREQSRREVQGTGRQGVVFPLAGLDPGWHEYAVRIPPVEGEATALNNVRRGVFRIASHRILLVYSRPNIELMELSRFLNTEYPGRTTAVNTRGQALRTLNPDDYMLLIIADVAPTALPPTVMQLIRHGSPATVILAGQHFAKWTVATAPSVPIMKHMGVTHLGRKTGGGVVRLRAQRHAPPFDLPEEQELPLNLIHSIEPTLRAHRVLSAYIGELALPLVLADRRTNPRCVVVTCDTTWKWRRHPQATVRRHYEAVWGGVIGWLAGGTERAGGLVLEPISAEPPKLEATVMVSPTSGRDADDLTAVTIIALEGQMERRLQVERHADRFRATYPYAPAEQRPYVVWFKATAQDSKGNQLESDRVPLAVPLNAQELADTAVHPDTLSTIVGTHTKLSGFAPDAAGVIKALLESLESKAPDSGRLERSRRLELSLAALTFLLLAVEWFLERRANARSGLS